MGTAHLALSAADRPLELRARRDLAITRVEFAGQPTFVVRDPVTLSTVQLSAEEYFLFTLLRERTSLAQMRREFERQFAPRRVTHAQLQEFVAALHDQGLLVGEQPGQGRELERRDRERRRHARWQSLLSLLAIRLASFPAGRLIDALYRVARPLLSPAGIGAACCLAALAATTLVAHGESLAAKLPALSELFAPRMLPVWLATIAGVKILHELGHALALRHFGGQCREMGVLLLAGVPTLYCDASEAWSIPAKGSRMLVSAAGMIAELLLAAAALVVWNATQPGLVNSLALAAAVVASVGTLAINANPLLRYDGYHILADWLEVPNLGQRSRRLASGWVRRWLLGEQVVDEPLLAPGKRRALAAYAVASVLYGLSIVAVLLAALVRFAAPHRAEALAYAAAAVVVAGLAWGPVRAVGRIVRDPRLRMRVKAPRLVALVAVALATVWGVWAWPIVRRVPAPVVVAAAHARPVFVAEAGAITAHVQPGDNVEAGDLLATLTDPDAEMDLAAQEGEVQLRRTRVAQLRTLRAAGTLAGSELPVAAAELADAEAQLAERRRQAALREIRAPTAGQVVAPPRRTAQTRGGDQLAEWSGRALDPANHGAWVDAGTPVGVIAAGGKSVAWAVLDPADVAAVAPGQAVRLAFVQAPFAAYRGEVVRVTRRMRHEDREEPGQRMSERRSDSVGGQVAYVAEIALEANAGQPDLLPSARGEAKIEIERSTVGALLYRELAEMFRLPW